MQEARLYQSVLRQLSVLPLEYLQLVEQFVSSLNRRIRDKNENREAVLALAGSWSDLSDQDFDLIRNVAKETGDAIFAREVDL